MSQTQRQPKVPTENPEPISTVRNRNGDAWYEYDGELLFDPETIERLHERYVEMQERDGENLAVVGGGSTKRLKIRTKDQEAFREAIAERREEHDFLMNVEVQLLGNHHGLHEEGPRKTVAWADYRAGRAASLGGADYKRQQLLLPVRRFEQWRYHTEVWLPVAERFNEEYPY